MMGFGMGWGLLLLALFFGLLFILLIVGVVFLVRRPGGASAAPEPRKTPRQILDDRLARGEISREEYEQLRAKIEQ